MTAKRYRKRPVIIEAVLFAGSEQSADEVAEWCGGVKWVRHVVTDEWVVSIPTLEGWMTASPGDYIIRGVQGEFYPCKPDIFAATYEEDDR